jgi:hypothetical protein
MRHTPGPWVVGNQDPLNFGKQRGNGTEPIGFVYGPSFPERSELGREALSNARLIAAAPELLEALKMGYADTMDYIQRNHLSGAENNRWLVLARAAIAKATGEQT